MGITRMWHSFIQLSPAFMLGFLVFVPIKSVKSSPESLAVFELSDFENAQIENFDGWRMSEKFDGVRAIWDGEQLTTKRGHLIVAPDWFLQQLPKFALDGELWVARQAFATVSSIVLSQTPDKRWKAVQYLIFEAPRQVGNLMQRLQPVQQFVRAHPNKVLKVIEQHPIKNQRHLQDFYQRVLAKGGEGIVIRDGNTEYATGRLTHALKYKPVQEAECVVVGYTPGKGQFEGWVGALKCQLLPAQMGRLFPKLTALNRPVEIRLGSGLTHQLRQVPPKLGQTITFEYTGLTKTGLPRFARFKRIRSSKD